MTTAVNAKTVTDRSKNGGVPSPRSPLFDAGIFLIIQRIIRGRGVRGETDLQPTEYPRLTAKPKILLVCDSREDAEQLLARAAESHEVVVANEPCGALTHLTQEPFAGVYVSSEYLQEALEIGRLLQNEQILEGMPDGVVLLDSDNSIIWSNGRLGEWSDRDRVVGANFYTVLGSPEILGPDFCPFHTALGHRSGHEFHAPQRREPLLPRPRRAGPRGGRSAAAPDRHRPRRDQRGPPAAEDGGHPPGRHGTGRSLAGGDRAHGGAATASSC